MTGDHPDGGDLQQAHTISRFWPVVSASVALALVLIMAGIIALRPTEPFAIDLRWMGEVVEHRSPFWTVPALVMNALGGGLIGVVIIPLGIVAAFLLWRRPWAALYYAIAAALSAGCVQLLKVTVDRARPEDMLVQSDPGSFPSGHTANAATTAVAIAIIFYPRVWLWVAGGAYAVAMALSRTYLGAHWLSDTIGGLLLGAGVAVLVWAPLAYKLAAEGARPHPFALARKPSPTL
ncbi:phosphatase PAP2 family protein [Diaminobutyricibacter sp. McL0618]|uniref:phosphatase PAP2 family protein n=1 Tax=Leifsonia sp. McL0618 TaxID=3415677 RepID=UPI003CF1F19D